MLEENAKLTELEENSKRNDLTGTQRKQYAAETERLNLILAELSQSLIETEHWFSEMIQRLKMPRPTVYRWWNSFCEESEIDLTPGSKEGQKLQHKFLDWLEEQAKKAQEEKDRKEAEARERHRYVAEAGRILAKIAEDRHAENFGAPGKARRFQRVQFPPRQEASHLTGNRVLGTWR